MVRNTQGQVSPARSRLLGTASRLFYTEGLHSVGVDRIVAEAGTTRATLYRHFPSKDDLIVSYLEEADRAVRNRLEHTRAGGLSAADTLRAIAADIAAFLNAAAEYSDPAHPVHRRIVAHREWFLSTVTDLFAQIDAASAAPAGRHFVMLRDGAMAAGCLSDPAPVCQTLLDGVDGLVRFHGDPHAGRTPRVEAEVG
jgi:AcrR family transcriptional regulator